MKDSIIFIY